MENHMIPDYTEEAMKFVASKRTWLRRQKDLRGEVTQKITELLTGKSTELKTHSVALESTDSLSDFRETIDARIRLIINGTADQGEDTLKLDAATARKRKPRIASDISSRGKIAKRLPGSDFQGRKVPRTHTELPKTKFNN